MKEIVKSLLLVFFVVLLSTFFSVNSRAASSTNQQIEELKQQIEEMQRQNQRQIQELQEKIEQLEVDRASEKEEIKEVIAKDKDAWYNRFEAGYKKGLYFKTKDGNFLMKMNTRAQFAFSVSNADILNTGDKDTTTSFNIRRFRITWKGNAFRPWFFYKVQLDGEGGSARFRDMYLGARYDERIVPRVGQYKVPFNRERLTSSSVLQFVERSISAAEFSVGRDIGTGLYGVLGNMITYGGGIFNGDGRNEVSTNSNLLYVGRIQFNPCCGKLKYGGDFPSGGAYKLVPNFGGREPVFAIGVAAYTNPKLDIRTKDLDDPGTENRFLELGITTGNVSGITFDVAFKQTIFSVVGSYDGRWIDPIETVTGAPLDTVYDQGFRVQAGIFLLPHYIELAGRYAYIDYDDGSGITGDVRDSSWQITPGINYYISHDHRWKIQLDYNFIKNKFTEGADVDENILRVQLQAYF